MAELNLDNVKERKTKREMVKEGLNIIKVKAITIIAKAAEYQRKVSKKAAEIDPKLASVAKKELKNVKKAQKDNKELSEKFSNVSKASGVAILDKKQRSKFKKADRELQSRKEKLNKQIKENTLSVKEMVGKFTLTRAKNAYGLLKEAKKAAGKGKNFINKKIENSRRIDVDQLKTELEESKKVILEMEKQTDRLKLRLQSNVDSKEVITIANEIQELASKQVAEELYAKKLEAKIKTKEEKLNN